MNNRLTIYIAQMGRFFSHFALRSLFFLYMVKALVISDFEAFSISAFICSMVELSALLGGLIADRYLGVRKATHWGSVLLFLGYGSLAIPSLFYPGLGLIIVGSCLFVSNISALLSQEVVKADAPFTKMYSLQNLSALAGTLLISSIAISYGFTVGFAIATVGISVSCIVLCFANFKEKAATHPSYTKPLIILSAVYTGSFTGCLYAPVVLPVLPLITLCAGFSILWHLRSTLTSALVIRLLALILFFVIEDQVTSSLMLLTERGVDRLLFHWIVPPSFIMALNPLVIILFAPWMAKRSFPLFVPFVITGIGFGILALLCAQLTVVPLICIMGVVCLISLAELMIAPSTLAFISTCAPPHATGAMMGLSSLAFAIAYQLSGLVGRFYFGQTHEIIAGYTIGFLSISMALILIASCLYFLWNKKNSILYEKIKRG